MIKIEDFTCSWMFTEPQHITPKIVLVVLLTTCSYPGT